MTVHPRTSTTNDCRKESAMINFTMPFWLVTSVFVKEHTHLRYLAGRALYSRPSLSCCWIFLLVKRTFECTVQFGSNSFICTRPLQRLHRLAFQLRRFTAILRSAGVVISLNLVFKDLIRNVWFRGRQDQRKSVCMRG